MRTDRAILAMFAPFAACAATAGASLDQASLDGTALAQNYAREVRPRLTVPDSDGNCCNFLTALFLGNS